MRESIPRQADKKSRVPEEESGPGALEVEMGSGVFKEEERTSFFFSPLHSLVLIT